MGKTRGALGLLAACFWFGFAVTCPSEVRAQADQKLTIDVPWDGFKLIYE